MKDELLFSEKQVLKQWWIWLLLLGVNGFFIWGCIQQIIFYRPFGNQPMSNTTLILMTVLMLLLSALFLRFRLETYIKEEGIYVRFFPFHLSFKYYDWLSINKLYIRKYSPFLEYGGWGIKRSTLLRGKAYSIWGNKGLQIEFCNHRKLLIGTQQAEEMERVLTEMGKLKR